VRCAVMLATSGGTTGAAVDAVLGSTVTGTAAVSGAGVVAPTVGAAAVCENAGVVPQLSVVQQRCKQLPGTRVSALQSISSVILHMRR
jgi:hypothetical protein